MNVTITVEVLLMNSKIVTFTKTCLDIIFVLSILGTLACPYLIKVYSMHQRANQYARIDQNYLLLCILFMIAGFLGILILYELRKMMKSVQKEDCFIYENVTSLRKMGTYAFLISIDMSLRVFTYITPSILLIVFTFLIAGLFSKVLALVFELAVQYKLENDMTI